MKTGDYSEVCQQKPWISSTLPFPCSPATAPHHAPGGKRRFILWRSWSRDSLSLQALDIIPDREPVPNSGSAIHHLKTQYLRDKGWRERKAGFIQEADNQRRGWTVVSKTIFSIQANLESLKSKTWGKGRGCYMQEKQVPRQ